MALICVEQGLHPCRQHTPGFLVAGMDLLAEPFDHPLIDLQAECRKLTSHLVTKKHYLRSESRDTLGQLLEDLDLPFQSVDALFQRFLRHRLLFGGA